MLKKETLKISIKLNEIVEFRTRQLEKYIIINRNKNDNRMKKKESEKEKNFFSFENKLLEKFIL